MKNKTGLTKKSLAMIAITLMLVGCGGNGSDPVEVANQAIVPRPKVPEIPPPAPSDPDLPPLATDQPYVNLVAYSMKADGNVSQHDEQAAITHHRIKLDGIDRTYTATAGHLVTSEQATLHRTHNRIASRR